MIIALPADQAEKAIAHLNANGETAWNIGVITRTNGGETVVIQ